MADSPSSQYSVDGLADLVANLPDSTGELKQQDPSDEVVFDVGILIRKLEAYKASVEDAQAQLRRKRSINPIEVSEVTAAARLKLRLDGRPPVSSESRDHSVLTSPTTLAFPSSLSSNASSSSETSYFDPMTPKDREEGPVAVLTSRTARDTWKSSHSVALQPEKKTLEPSTRPSVPLRSPGEQVWETPETEFARMPTINLDGSKLTFSSPLASPAFTASDWLGVSRAATSLTTSKAGEGRKSFDEMSMCPPDEDRIRREIESYTIKDWIDTEDIKQLEVIAYAKEPVLVQGIPSKGHADDEDLEQPQRIEMESEQPSQQYAYGKTTFREKMGSLFHRRTKTDKIIELYFDMETSPRQSSTRTRTKKRVSTPKD